MSILRRRILTNMSSTTPYLPGYILATTTASSTGSAISLTYNNLADGGGGTTVTMAVDGNPPTVNRIYTMPSVVELISTYEMFYYQIDLATINLSNLNTSKVTNMNEMFRDCSSLTSINLSNFNTSKVTNMDGMFYRCSGLTSIDLSNFDTTKVTKMDSMFYNCIKLQSLTLSQSFFKSTSTNSLNLSQTNLPSTFLQDLLNNNKFYNRVSNGISTIFTIIARSNMILTSAQESTIEAMGYDISGHSN